MSRLFNNKYSISILVAIAIAFCASRIVQSASNEVYVASDIPDMLDAETSDAQKNQSRSLKSVNVTGLFWNDKAKRDPFGVKSSTTLYKKNNSNSATPDQKPRMTALVAGVDSKFAVINGKIVSEGQHINNYKVVKIKPDGVHLKEFNRDSNIMLSME